MKYGWICSPLLWPTGIGKPIFTLPGVHSYAYVDAQAMFGIFFRRVPIAAQPKWCEGPR